jgi:glycosyltransferase involved in cell wall biosynthesis
MASIQSCLAGPILRFRKIKHFLWYAHAQNSIILRIAHFWVTKLVTSTVGSCPLSGKKILYLGQSINQNKFAVRANLTFPLRRFIHIGRADPSKNLNLIIETVFHFRQFDSDLRLEIVGNPSGSRQNIELESLKQFWADGINKGWLVFSPAIPRGQIPKLLHQHDVFIHAFKGSLDKTLIEATMTGLPVITINQEYVNEFGSWGGDPISLESELASLMNYVEKEVTERVRERTSIAIAKHSSITWIDNLEACLRSV